MEKKRVFLLERDRIKAGAVASLIEQAGHEECGGRLFHLADDGAEICLGSLDEAPTSLSPTREGWIKRREVWMLPVGAAFQAETDPPFDT